MDMLWEGNPFIKKKEMSIYVHIPFCVSKCTYCNFVSFADKCKFIPKYLNALYREIDQRAVDYRDYHITTIYIGGGTPSSLPDGEIDKLVQYIRSKFNVQYDESVTIEANPNSLTLKKAKEFFNAGINRISIGLQTHNAKLLRLLNRPHTFAQFKEAFHNAEKAGFSDISTDILLGIPTQKMADLKGTLDKILKMPFTHISAYGLILEEGTALTKMIESGKLKPCNEDLANDMYDYTVKRLADGGYIRYEISNFAKPHYASQHNLNYWRRGQYLGLGLASHSFVDGKHWQNTEDLDKYIKNPEDSRENVEIETIKTAKLEAIMLALRTDEGLDIKQFNADYNANFIQDYQEVIHKLLKGNLITIKNFVVKINDFNVSNAIIAEFVE